MEEHTARVDAAAAEVDVVAAGAPPSVPRDDVDTARFERLLATLDRAPGSTVGSGSGSHGSGSSDSSLRSANRMRFRRRTDGGGRKSIGVPLARRRIDECSEESGACGGPGLASLATWKELRVFLEGVHHITGGQNSRGASGSGCSSSSGRYGSGGGGARSSESSVRDHPRKQIVPPSDPDADEVARILLAGSLKAARTASCQVSDKAPRRQGPEAEEGLEREAGSAKQREVAIGDKASRNGGEAPVAVLEESVGDMLKENPVWVSVETTVDTMGDEVLLGEDEDMDSGSFPISLLSDETLDSYVGQMEKLVETLVDSTSELIGEQKELRARMLRASRSDLES